MNRYLHIKKYITLPIVLAGLLFLTTCEVFSPGLGEEIDKDNPLIGIESHGNGTYVAETILLTGYATDDLGVESIVLSHGSTEYTAELSGESWSLSLDTSVFPDGDFEITATATDESGKTVSTNILLIVDNSPPSVLVTTPTSYNDYGADPEDPADGLGDDVIFSFNKMITIKGEAADTTRVKKVYVSLYDSGGTPVLENAEATGTSSWYYTFNSLEFHSETDPAEIYHYMITAEDYSGNRSAWFYHFKDILALGSPNIEQINAADFQDGNISGLSSLRLNSSSAPRMDITIDPASDNPQFDFLSPLVIVSPGDPLSENRYSVPQRLMGYVEDDDGIDSVQLALFAYDTDEPVNLTGVVIADSWMSPAGSGAANENPAFSFSYPQWTLDAELPEGSYYVRLSATDAQLTDPASATSLDVPFSVSASSPSIAITAPDPGEYVGVGSALTIYVTVKNSDGSPWTGSEMYIDADGDGSWTEASALLMDPDLLNPGDFSLDLTEGVSTGFSFSSDGTYIIRLRAGTGTSAGNASLGITADITEPTMQITTPGNGETINGTVTVRGTSDDIAVDTVWVKVEEGDIAEYASYPSDPASNGWTDITNSVYNWNYTLDTTAHPDPGVLTLHYFAEDVAGNYGSDGSLAHPARITVTADQSTDDPIINISQPTDGGRLGVDSSIIGNIIDDDMVDVSTLMISLDIGNDGSFDTPIAVSSPPSSDSTNATWNHSLAGIPEGAHAFTITVDDLKANGDPVVTSSLTYSFIVDGGPPALEITAPSANSLWNNNVLVAGTTADANGVAAMAFSTDGATWIDLETDAEGVFSPTTDGTQINWSYTFGVDPDGADDKQYNIQVRSVDQAGATTTEYLPFEVDTSAPVLEITKPPESVTVNGDSIEVAGTVSDVNDVTGLYYYISPDSAMPPTAQGDFTGWTPIDPIAYSWSFTFSPLGVNGSPDATNYKIWLRSFDHGDLLNETDDTLADHSLVFTIDQKTDRPIVTFNDIDKSSVIATDNVLVGATTLSGLIEDDDLIDPSTAVEIEISIDGSAWETVDTAPLVGDPAKGTITWKHSIAGLVEGLHHVKVRARDNQSDGLSGDSSSSDPAHIYNTNFNWGIAENADLTVANIDPLKSQGVPFILNLGAPTVVVDAPTAYSYHNNDVDISGTASDANGVTDVDISFDNGGTWIPLTITAGDNVSWSYTLPVSDIDAHTNGTLDGNPDGVADGDKTVTYIVRATDTYTSSGIQNGQFTIDATDPTISVSHPNPSSTSTVNGSVSFFGTAGDNGTLSGVYFSILPKWTDGTHTVLTADPVSLTIAADGSVSNVGDYTAATGSYSWSDSFVTTDTGIFTQGDETYIFRALSVDLAGNVSDLESIEFIVDQETDRPVLGISTFSDAGTLLTNIMPASQQIIGTVSDDDSVQNSLLMVQVTNEDNSAPIVGYEYSAISSPPASSETWSHIFSTNLPNGRYNLYIRAADGNFNDGSDNYEAANYYWNEIGPIPFSVDTDFPVTTQNLSEGDLFNSSFNISGTASDSNGIKSIVVDFDFEVNGVVTSDTATFSFPNPFVVPSYNWSTTVDILSDGTNDGEVNYQVTVTDAFGKENVTQYSRTVYVDTQTPDITIIGPADGSTLNGSIYVFGSGVDSDTTESEVESVWVWVGNDTTDFDSGATDGDIDPPTPGDASWTLLAGTDSWNHRFKAAPFDGDIWGVFVLAQDNFGNYTDPTPDSISIIVDESENIPVITLLTADGSLLGLNAGDVIEGTITDDDYVDVSTLQISFDNGATWTDVSNRPAIDSSYVSFAHPLTAVTASATPYQVLVTVNDLGENFAGTEHDIAPVSATTAPIAITVDKELPDSALTLIDNGLTTSGTTTGLFINDSLRITGISSDDVQVQSVQVRLGDGNFTAYSAATDTGTNFSTWEWEETSNLGLTADTTLDILITDVNSRTNLYTYQLRVDTFDPTVTFTTTSTNPDTDYGDYGSFQGAYNGNQEFKGEASDNIQITSVYYLFDGNATASYGDGTGWTSATGTYSWSTVFDTTAVTDGNTHYLHMIAADGAGNFSAVQNLSFVVHQSSDDPIVSITQPVDTGLLESNAKVIGTARDDDGLTDIEISIDSAAYGNVSSPGTVSGKSVNFEHDLSALADGSYTIQVRATDGTVTMTSSLITFDIDTLAPALSLDTITIQDRYPSNPGTSDTVINSSFNGSYINNDSTLVFTATDASGIASVDFSLNGAAFGNADVAAPYTYALSVPLNGSLDGTNTLSYRATDVHGKTTTNILTFIVDTGEPVIDFSNPVNMFTYATSDPVADPPTDDAPNVNGDVTVRGSISDSSSISSVSITGGKTAAPLTNTGNTISWITSIANSGNYANATDSYNTGDTGASPWDDNDDGDETWTNEWRFPVEVTATDLAGNITSTTGYIDIDPDSDNPVVSVVSPANDASVSGTFLVNGTIQDDDGTDYVTLEFDLDDDGVYDGTGNITVNGSSINETTATQLSAPNGSWSVALNASEFSTAIITGAGYAYGDPSGTEGFIRMRLTPYDTNGLAGASQTVRIYLDTTSPVIEGLDVDGTTEVADPTPAGGTLQNGTITLRARFEDDKELLETSMLISFDGGATFESLADALLNNAAVTRADVTDQLTSAPYKYYVEIDLDTSSAVAGGNGLLAIQLNVTDQTNKQSSESITYSVDNTLPTIHWNEDGSGVLQDLPFVGTPPAETYTFKGNDTTLATDDAFKVLGAAIDTGTISGIEKVNIYFVKDIAGTDYFISPVDSGTYANLVVSNQAVDDDGDPGTAAVSIPFTENSNYLITIDNRIEQGTFDQTGGIGDADGFNESLKTKSGYDEWYAFYDTLELPDGPLTIFAVAYDEAGNMSYTSANGQIANNPPSLDSVVIGGTSTLEPDGETQAKKGGTQSFVLNATDVEGITVDDFKLSFLESYSHTPSGPDTDNPVAITEFFYGSQGGAVADFGSRSPASGSAVSASATVNIDTTNATYFTDGMWYLAEAEAKDTDGNITTFRFYLWVYNTDTNAPIVTMDDFTQLSVDGLDGHVENSGDSPHLDSQADISGAVYVTGTVYDDTQVDSLSLQLSYDNGTTWNPGDTIDITASMGAASGNAIDGHTWPYSYEWDTSGITGVAFSDLQVRVQADDLSQTGENTPIVVDVVPYITGITGTGFDSGLLTYVRRSATGRYPVTAGGTITISGYNLPADAASGVYIGGTVNAGVESGGLAIQGEAGSTTTSVDTDTTGASSGTVYIQTNGVMSLNNLNGSLPQNLEAETYNPNLTDNREIVFWSVSSQTGTSAVTDPFMASNPSGNGFDWLYVSSGKILNLRNSLGSEIKLTEGTGLAGGTFAYNGSGSLNFLFNHNSQWSFAADTFAYTGSVQQGLLTSPYSFAYVADRDESYNWNSGVTYGRLGLGNVSFGYETASNNDSYNPIPIGTYGNMDLNRYSNIKLETVGDDSLMHNFVAYFDSGANESRSIVFYAYQTSNSAASLNGSLDVYSNSGTADDSDIGGGFYANLDKFSNKGPAINQNVSLSGSMDNNNNGLATPRGRQEVTVADSGADSDMFDLAILELDLVGGDSVTDTIYGFIAYFDEAAQQLKITANESLFTADPTGALGTWTTPFTVDSGSNAGAYVAMDVDPDGGIHLAYQDVSSGYLKYAYLTYTSGGTFTEHETVFVDALFGAGTNNSISVRDFDDTTTGTDYRPVIFTYSSAYTGTRAPLRMSYPVNAQSGNAYGAGADSTSGAFIGNWETVALLAGSNPDNRKNFLYLNNVDAINGGGEPYIGYEASNLEEATFLGF